ncbi:hypothetical protein DPMN_014516 [Dreissena polymorpha]|uniref:Uncharacterized protein n=1 Tax=Dreissena polymorpha TaxID=45954 RepID=A0A9D4N7F7_DREPO|nr:hypothetical protein DPMN_014516 [Dreissena polymorpha]
MSRYPHECVTLKDITKKVEIEDSTIKAICCINCTEQIPAIETLHCNNINIVEVTETPDNVMAQIELREIRSHQRNDPLIE